MNWRKATLLLVIPVLALVFLGLNSSSRAEEVPEGGFFVRVPAAAVTDAAALELNPLVALDYGAFQWLELSPSDFTRLSDSGLAFTHVPQAGQVQIVTYAFDPLSDGVPALDQALENSSDGPALRLVQFNGPTNDAWLADMAAAGLAPLQYYPHNAFLTWGSAEQVSEFSSYPFVRWQGVIHPAYKTDPALQDRTGTIANVDVMFYNDGDIEATLAAIEALGGNILQHYPSQPDKAFYNAIVELDAAALNDVARLQTVLWQGFSSPEPILDDEMSSQIVAGNHPGGVPVTGYNAHLANLGFDGSGVTWAIVDTGVDYDHPDLGPHIVGGYSFPGACNPPGQPGSDCPGGGHGTHVAGIIGGDATGGFTDPNGFLYGLGVAPGYGIFAMNSLSASSWPPAGGWQEHSKQAVLGGAIGGNNSWTTGEGTNHGYQASERTHDIMVLDGNFDTTTVAEPFIEVFSAGNSGASGLTAPKEGKNLIVTASSRNYRAGSIDTISSFSSRGPAVDGRWVPTITAPGEQIASTRNDGGGSCGTPIAGTNNLYSYCSGTSMAAPHVAGTIALTTEWWRTWNGGADPSPAMAKALVVNTAVDMGTADIPNIEEGWGRINVTHIVSPTAMVVTYDQTHVFNNTGEQWQIQVGVPDPGQPLKITLAWADAPGAVGADPALVNDLNLTVDNGGNTYFGNVFSGGWSATGGSADSINNLENVYVQNPGGSATITIDAANISGDAILYNADTTDQSFALVCSNCALFPDFTLTPTPDSQQICAPADAVYTIDVGSIMGFSDPVTLSAVSVPAGASSSFSVNPVTPPGSSDLTIGNTGAAAAGSYSIDVVGIAPTSTHTTTVGLNLYDSTPGMPALQQPADGAVDVSFIPSFQWSAAAQAQTYALEVATDMAFTNVVYTASVTSNSHTATMALSAATTYYWRVTADNVCGTGATSAIFSFTTQTSSLVCNGATVAFESGIPADWTVLNNATGNPVFWTDIAGCGEGGNYATGTGDAACASSDNQGGGAGSYNTELWSPPLDLSNAFTVTLDYWANYGNFAGVDFLNLDISVDGGSTWTTILSWNEDHHPNGLRTAPGENVVLDLSAYSGYSNAILRWHYYDPSGSTAQDWYAQIDEVDISCGAFGTTPSVNLNKTVGLDPASCAATDTILIGSGTDVTYCYEIQNTSAVTLTMHDLVDTELGNILSGLAYSLTPGARVFVTSTTNITQTTVNTATWTAYNPGPVDVATAMDSATVNVLGATSFPTCTDFESGLLPNYFYATTTSDGGANGRVQVTTANPFSGSYAVDMDTDCDGCGGSTTQSATMIIDLGSVTTAELNFWVREFGDENDPEDGVFISDDGGATWAQIYSFNGLPASYQNVIMDLAAAASGAGMSLVDGFQIRFQGKDNFSIPTDGYSLDDICVQVAQPDIAVSPLALTSTQYVGEVTMQSLTIDNTGSLALNWDFEEAPADCSSPADLPWASVNPITGTTPSLSSSTADVTFDSAGLMPDTVYTGTLCLNSDDPDTPLIPIPLTLNVQGRADIEVDPTAIVNSQLPDVQATFPLTISNIGDVPLTWLVVEGTGTRAAAQVVANAPQPDNDVAATSRRSPLPLALGDELFQIDVGAAASTGSLVALGVEYADGSYWVTTAGIAANTEPNYLFQLDDAGAVLNSWQQPNSSVWGWRDLAFDGTYLYASDSAVLDQIDPATGQATGVTIPCPENPCRALAYDPATDHFWTQNFGGSLYEFDRSGTVISTSSNGLAAYGAAWDSWSAGGPYIWIWSQDGPDTNQLVTATQIDPATGTPTGVSFLGTAIGAPGVDDNIAGGATISPDIVPGTLVFAGLHQAPSDTIVGYDLDVALGCTPTDLPWASVAPSSGTTPIGGSSLVDVTLDSTGYGPGTYSGALCVESNDPLEPTVQVPLTMTVQPSADYGRVEGTVQSLGYCDANPFPAAGALVEITSSMGAMVTRTADSNGFYDVWLNVNGNPYTVTVSAPAHVGQTAAGVTVTGQMTTTLDFDLRLLEPCVAVSPTGYDVNVGAGSMRVETLTIDNSGAGVLNWLIEEEPGALRQPLAGTLYTAPAAGSVVSFGEFSFSSQTGAVAAAAPAVNAPVAPNATLTLTHSATQNIVSGNSVSCNAGGLHADNSYIRRFTLSDFGITDAFDVMMVQIGIETATGAGGTQPATVNLYTWDPADPFTFANFTLIGTADTQVPDQALAIFNVPVTGTVPAGGTLVAEFFTPNGQTAGHSLFVGSNPDGQTDGTFLTAADCGITDPTDTAAIGFPDMHLVMNVVGDSGGSGTICSAPADIPWLSANPTSGATLGDTSSVVDVTFDAGSLSTGVYTGTLCVNSDDSMMPVVPVPVTMTVAAPQAAINLAVTVSDSNTCGSSDTITVNAGDTVYYCYTVTNTGNVMLPNHTISDTVYGHIDTFLYDLFPGMSESVIYSQTVSAAVSSTATWTASHAGLGASAQASDSASVELADYMLYMPVVIKP